MNKKSKTLDLKQDLKKAKEKAKPITKEAKIRIIKQALEQLSEKKVTLAKIKEAWSLPPGEKLKTTPEIENNGVNTFYIGEWLRKLGYVAEKDFFAPLFDNHGVYFETLNKANEAISAMQTLMPHMKFSVSADGQIMGNSSDKQSFKPYYRVVAFKTSSESNSRGVGSNQVTSTSPINQTIQEQMKNILTKEQKIAKVTEAIEKMTGKKVVLEPKSSKKKSVREASKEDKDSKKDSDKKDNASKSTNEAAPTTPTLGDIVAPSSIKTIEEYVEQTLQEIEANVKELRAFKKTIGNSATATGEDWRQKTDRLKFNIEQLGRVAQFINNTIVANKFDKTLLNKIINLQK